MCGCIRAVETPADLARARSWRVAQCRSILAILRQLHAVITTGQAWDPNIATHGTRRMPTTLAEVAA
jgi:hypothetical protein